MTKTKIKLTSSKHILGAALAAALLVALAGAAPASAALPALECSGCTPWWMVNSASVPTNLPPGGPGTIDVTATNLGDAPVASEAIFTDVLPQGVTAKSISFTESYIEFVEEIHPECVVLPNEVTCVIPATTKDNTVLEPFEMLEAQIAVSVAEDAHAGEVNKVSITGGGAPSVSRNALLAVGRTITKFGVENYELRPENDDGSFDAQAGSHPFQLTTAFYLNNSEPSTPLAKDLRFNLPPGLIGNPVPFPECTAVKFTTIISERHNLCPDDTAIGVAAITAEYIKRTAPLFNLVPEAGEPARFGFEVEGVPVYLDTSIRTGGDDGVTVTVANIAQLLQFESSRVTFWGVPGDPRHDNERGWNCLQANDEPSISPPCTASGELNPPPLLTLPTACTGPIPTTVEADSWMQPTVRLSREYTLQDELGRPLGMDGCNKVPFTPSVKVTPDGQAGSTPTGLTVDEHVPQETSLNPTGLAESDVKGLSVTLPEGVALNPSAADGLQACTQEEIGLQSPEAATCAEAAKVATVKIKTPLLPNALEGAAYLATQDANPFGSLVALYVYAEDPVSGVRAKAAGEVLENPLTGQLTAHFEGDPVFQNDPRYAGEVAAQFLPELPFEDIELRFFGGDRAPLTSPARCGGYTTTGTFVPWSGNETVDSSSEFKVISGPNGSPCADPLPFSPSLTAGTTSIQAGGFTPFEMTMSREDGSQNLQGIQLHMPIGMSGTLSTVKLCGEAQADAGTCGPESQIGETIISVGVGGDPFTVTGGKVYVTGPYKGAPFGLSIVNPAKAGPFNLGQVVVRAKIDVNSETAALTITTDNEGPYKIPTILDGIPLQIKHVNVDINRPGFTFNATNCSPLAITGTLVSTEGASSALSVPYQVTNCAVLAFKPKLEASTSGKPSRADGASLHVKLGYPAGPYDANIARVKVELPKALPSRLATLQKACTAKQFEVNPAGCPPASIVGHAKATTPVLPVPLEGPAYFVSHGNEEFPALIIVLQGYGVTVHLVGSTFISKTGVTSSTFKTVPDVPVGTFELTLPQGPFSALGANRNLCKGALDMPTEFVGQNGALIKTTTKIAVTGCPKAKKASHKKKHKKAKGAKKKKK